MPDSVAVSFDETKLGIQPVWVNRQAMLDFFNSLSVIVGVNEDDIGVVIVQGALSAVVESVSESQLSINALDENGNTTLFTVPTIDYTDSLKTNIEELQTLHAELKASLIAAGITV